jgi:hypothetical protein
VKSTEISVSGKATYQDLAAWSDDNPRVAIIRSESYSRCGQVLSKGQIIDCSGESYIERLGPTGKARTMYRCGERGLRPKG